MHALLAHATHLALMPVHLAWLPMWRPLLVALAVAMAARAAGGRAPLSAALATLSGWAAQDFGGLAAWPPPAAGRLPGLALIVAIEAVVRQRAKGKPGPWLLPLAAASGA